MGCNIYLYMDNATPHFNLANIFPTLYRDLQLTLSCPNIVCHLDQLMSYDQRVCSTQSLHYNILKVSLVSKLMQPPILIFRVKLFMITSYHNLALYKYMQLGT